MNDFLSFRKFVTPLFIQALFWVLVVVAVGSALAMMLRGTAGSIFTGLVWLVVGPVMARVYCELLILLFRIYDELVAMRTGVPPTPQQGFPIFPTGAAPYPQPVSPPPPGVG